MRSFNLCIDRDIQRDIGHSVLVQLNLPASKLPMSKTSRQLKIKSSFHLLHLLLTQRFVSLEPEPSVKPIADLTIPDTN